MSRSAEFGGVRAVSAPGERHRGDPGVRQCMRAHSEPRRQEALPRRVAAVPSARARCEIRLRVRQLRIGMLIVWRISSSERRPLMTKLGEGGRGTAAGATGQSGYAERRTKHDMRRRKGRIGTDASPPGEKRPPDHLDCGRTPTKAASHATVRIPPGSGISG